MNKTEFAGWLDRHAARFQGIANMLDRDQTIAKDYLLMLGGFDVEHANQATLELMAMDPQPFPNDHLPKLIAICKRLRMKIKKTIELVDYRQTDTFRCSTCHDFGCIWVFHPMAYKPIREGYFDPKMHFRDIVVGCKCPPSQQFVNKPEPQPGDKKQFSAMLRFDESKMLPVRDWDNNRDRDETDLIEFVDRMRHKNHKTEFDAFA